MSAAANEIKYSLLPVLIRLPHFLPNSLFSFCMKTLVLFYSTYGHVWKLAEAIAEGARAVAGNEVVVKRVPEPYPKKCWIK